MKKRIIRLKEQEPDTVRVYTPSDDYRKIRPTLDRKLSYLTTVNDDGFMITGNYVKAPQKIFLLGGSFVENMYTSQNHRIHSQIERQLIAQGYYVEVLNSGVSGSTSLNLFNVVINKIAPYAPCTIVFVISINDVHALSFDSGFWNKYRLFSTLDQTTDLERARQNISEKNIADLTKLYMSLKMFCELFNINLLIANTPYISIIDDNFYKLDHSYYARMVARRERIYGALFGLFKRQGFDSLDLHLAMNENKELFFDDVHTNAIGSSVVANIIVPRLKKYVKRTDGNARIQVYRCLDHAQRLSTDVLWSSSMIMPENMAGFSHAMIEYQVECGSDVIENNALFCVDFGGIECDRAEVGLKYSDTVGFFSYLQTGAGLALSGAQQFSIPHSCRELRVGIGLWKRRSDIKISDVQLTLFFHS